MARSARFCKNRHWLLTLLPFLVGRHAIIPVEPLVFAGLEPFARGGGRDFYVHPGDPGLCVKVAREGRSPAERLRQEPWWKRWRKPAHKYDDSLRDYRTLKALELSGDAAIWQCLPRLHGWVETDRGRGLVTDLIRDADGSVSRSLLDYLRIHGHDDRVRAVVDEFARARGARPVPARSLFPDNIAAQVRDDVTLRLVVIDGLGNAVVIPRHTWSKALGLIWARRSIRFLRCDIAVLCSRARAGQADSPRRARCFDWGAGGGDGARVTGARFCGGMCGGCRVRAAMAARAVRMGGAVDGGSYRRLPMVYAACTGMAWRWSTMRLAASTYTSSGS